MNNKQWMVGMLLTVAAAGACAQEFMRLPSRADRAFEASSESFTRSGSGRAMEVFQGQEQGGAIPGMFGVAGRFAGAMSERFGRAVREEELSLMGSGSGSRRNVQEMERSVQPSGPVRELRRVPRVAEPKDLAELAAVAAHVSGGADCVVWVGPNFGLSNYAGLLAGVDSSTGASGLARFAENLRKDFSDEKSAQKRDLGWRYKLSFEGRSARIEPIGYSGVGADEVRRMCVQ